jgi:hypothetical protein
MEKETLKEFAKFLIDVAKLIIGGAILTTIIKYEDINKFSLILVSSLISITLMIIAFSLHNKASKK